MRWVSQHSPPENGKWPAAPSIPTTDTLQTTLEHEPLQALRQDPALQSLIERLPAPIRDNFTEKQLAALKLALAARTGSSHTSPSVQSPSQIETRRNCPRCGVWLD